MTRGEGDESSSARPREGEALAAVGRATRLRYRSEQSKSGTRLQRRSDGRDQSSDATRDERKP